MKRKGGFEKRIFVLFFIVAFALILVFTLLEWQIVRYSILQNEDKQMNSVLNQFESEYNRFLNERSLLLREKVENPELRRAVQTGEFRALTQTLERERDQYSGVFLIFDTEQRRIYGISFPQIDRYIPYLFRQNQHNQRGQFPISLGNDNIHLSYEYLYDSNDEENEFLGLILYLELINFNRFDLSREANLFFFTQTENLDQLSLPDLYNNNISLLKRNINRAVDSYKTSANLRLNIDLAAALSVKYDIFGEPTLFVLSPFVREFNSFAHKGLLVFLLILLAMALLMISISGSWFSRKIIEPVKEVSERMQEIENNPSNLEPMEKRYDGILGDMIDTFNSMNSSLNRYSQSLLEYKIIINNLDSAILWMDDNFQIILCNPSALKIFDLQRYRDVIGKYLTELIQLDDKITAKAKKKGLFIPQFELNSTEQQKYLKFVIFNIHAVDDTRGLRYVASITDITKETKEQRARENLEIELIKSNRLAELGRIVEGVVHNINSPLNTIVGYCQLLQKRHPELTDIEKIRLAGNNISKMVKVLLSKVREDSISMMRPLDINEIVEQELEMCRHNIFFAQNIKLKKDLSPESCHINATSGEISLCIANLINNAIQAMEKSKTKRMQIKTYPTDDCVTFEVSDTGCGIAEEDIEYIFNPDFSTKSDDKGSGFGLGLAISKNIAEKYKGKITVESTPGEGSTFKLIFPCIDR